jgi:DNA-directed RNA polymerase subunit RPC12/RpoP
MGDPESAPRVRAYQLLRDARALLVRGWTRGARARDADGRAVDATHPSARSWSLAGALEAASARQAGARDGDAEAARARATALVALMAVVREQTPSEDREADGAAPKANDGKSGVRCLRCGAFYRRQAGHVSLETAAACPRCGYQGWASAEDEPRDREDAD